MGYPSDKNPKRLVFLQRLVNELVDQGNQCTVISPVKFPADKETIIGFEEQKTNSGNIVKAYFPAYFCMRLTARYRNDPFKNLSVHNYQKAAERVIHKNKIEFDVVYSHFLGVSAECAVKIASMYNVPCFAAAGESVFSYYDAPDCFRVNRYLNKLAGIVSVSSANKQILVSRGLNGDNIKVFPNGIDTSMFYRRDKAESRMKMGFNNDDFIVAFTGAFIERKGVLRLQEATKDLPVKVAYAGSGPQMPNSNNTIWCKPVTPENMPCFLSAADIFVLPTLNEGCCNSIIEAMACGLPVISADKPFNNDILDDSCSIRVDPSDVSAIRNSIIKLYENKSLVEKLSKGSVEKSRMLDLKQRASGISSWISERL